MKLSIVRGAFLNPYELQNFSPLKDEYDITVYSSKHPISDKIDLPLKKLWSPTDLPQFPFKTQIINRLFVDAQRLSGLEKEIKGSDIVHVAETYFGYTHQAIMTKRRGSVRKVVSTVWEVIPHNNEGIRGRKEYKRLAYESVDKFIAVTEKAKQTLINEGVRPEKIAVVNMGIDIEKFQPSKEKKTKRDINILCVARFVPEKGITDLLKAFLRIRKKNQYVRLTFVGSGPLKQDIFGFKNVSVKSVSYSQIHREYQKADIFCLPSRETNTWQEQYGMCLLEAMASSLPIITTNSGAIPEVVGDAALVIHHSNIKELQINLEKLINDSDLRLSLSQKARQRAEDRYDRRQVAKKINEVYQDLFIKTPA